MSQELYTLPYQSPIGAIKISGTETYITEMKFYDSIENIPNDQNTSIPHLMIQAMEQLIQYFNGERRIFDLPLNQSGTDFQLKVWHELMNISYGKTISYQALSKCLGDPKVIRAAASANGKNNICIIVPCHRVIGSNNDLVGYSGGLWRKKWLLDLENKIANGVQTLF